MLSDQLHSHYKVTWEPFWQWFFWRKVKFLVKTILITMLLFPLAALVLLRFVEPPLTTGMVAAKLNGHTIRHKFVPLERISRHFVPAVIMSEDNRFCDHWGVDWEAIGKQLKRLEKGQRPRGASTITMQTTRAIFLWQGRSYLRKALELPLATLMSLILPKRRVMELYLNVAEWGPGIYGVEAAARSYFGKPAATLSKHQVALLVAALPNPRLRRPNRPSRFLRKRARRVAWRASRARGYLKCLRNESNHRWASRR